MEDYKSDQIKFADKLYFKVGEVSELTGIPTYVLRFWETEFKNINPKRTPSGQRLYRKNDVLTILKIKELLYEKKFTIQGAKKHLKSLPASDEHKDLQSLIKEIRAELKNIRKIIE
jgi:DNA-binding transcriptional MerR regulator